MMMISDAFEKMPEFADKIPLELEVTVYNINAGHNEDILAKSATLKDYSIFVAAVRKYLAQAQLLDEAIKNAVTECVNADILADFLELHSSEVLNMLTQEWNTQTYGDIRYDEGLQEGREQGREYGLQQGLQQGMERGLQQRSYETARVLFELNLPLEQIAKATQLPIDKLRELRQSI